MEQKKFMDIQRLKEGYADGFVPGDLIVIQEKFDGSNAAARYDAETGKMVALSWIVTCVIIKLITLCFGVAFSWLIATGIWLVFLLLKSVFGK